MTRVGLVGLGTMGGPMAAALVAAGADLLATDVVADLRATAEEAGVAVTESLAEVAEHAEMVLLSLPTPAVVVEVTEQLWHHSPGLVVVDTSTTDPLTSRTLAAQGRFVDAPVLGRPAAVGRWTMPVGCDESLEPLVAEVLAPLAARVVRVGASGSGATVKVCNNLMLSAINAVTAEALALAEAAGLDAGTFVDVVIDSGAASVSGLFRDVAPRAVSGDFAPVFGTALMRKDAQLALDLAAEVGVPLRVVEASQSLNDDAVAAGLGAEDSIAVVKTLWSRSPGGSQ
ncbi:NAD(P)-dependent oxidoreductase [Aestuariimicrobium ganziense]|uniref:NAD(P)-dependent oxidoreductase n=1 Tax=Aestuariimicrobium ganziense TaxID=2773677 RepID=UPI001942B853|nr:NAD(P)-dependent oxidoreductase [Aestuariimicrobium ganziense]